MNDFTKEELIALKNGIEYLPDRVNIGNKYQGMCDEIVSKIQAMIDNYCKHDPRETKGPIGMYHCPECGDMQIGGFKHVRLKDDNK